MATAITPEEDQVLAAEAAAAWLSSLQDTVRKSVAEKEAERSIFRDSGFTYVKATAVGPCEYIDTDKVRLAIHGIVRVALVVDKDTRDSLPVERLKLAEQMLVGPSPLQGDEWEGLSATRRRGWLLAEQTIWGKYVQDAFGSPLQKMVREDEDLPDGTVLIKSGDAVFVTAEPKYIRQGILLPVVDAHVFSAEAMGKTLGLFSGHNPALKAGARKLLNSAVKAGDEKAHAAFLLNSGADADEDE